MGISCGRRCTIFEYNYIVYHFCACMRFFAAELENKNTNQKKKNKKENKKQYTRQSTKRRKNKNKQIKENRKNEEKRKEKRKKRRLAFTHEMKSLWRLYCSVGVGWAHSLSHGWLLHPLRKRKKRNKKEKKRDKINISNAYSGVEMFVHPYVIHMSHIINHHSKGLSGLSLAHERKTKRVMLLDLY